MLTIRAPQKILPLFGLGALPTPAEHHSLSVLLAAPSSTTAARVSCSCVLFRERAWGAARMVFGPRYPRPKLFPSPGHPLPVPVAPFAPALQQPYLALADLQLPTPPCSCSFPACLLAHSLCGRFAFLI